MEDTLVDIFDSVEVITNDEVNNMSDTGIITIDEIFNNQNIKPNDNTMVKEEIKENPKEEVNLQSSLPELVKKKDTVLIIQIGLLITWIILTVLIYFFGYNLFEPFIKVSQQ